MDTLLANENQKNTIRSFFGRYKFLKSEKAFFESDMTEIDELMEKEELVFKDTLLGWMNGILEQENFRKEQEKLRKEQAKVKDLKSSLLKYLDNDHWRVKIEKYFHSF